MRTLRPSVTAEAQCQLQRQTVSDPDRFWHFRCIQRAL